MDDVVDVVFKENIIFNITAAAAASSYYSKQQATYSKTILYVCVCIFHYITIIYATCMTKLCVQLMHPKKEVLFSNVFKRKAL